MCHNVHAQGEIKSHEVAEKKLNEKVAELTGELETQKGQMVAARETLEQTKAQKEAFMKGKFRMEITLAFACLRN